jgi:hypothetical protein
MSSRPSEHLAYSIQDLGSAWRWRIYGAAGRVLRDGLAPTKRAAELSALGAFRLRPSGRQAA